MKQGCLHEQSCIRRIFKTQKISPCFQYFVQRSRVVIIRDLTVKPKLCRVVVCLSQLDRCEGFRKSVKFTFCICQRWDTNLSSCHTVRKRGQVVCYAETTLAARLKSDRANTPKGIQNGHSGPRKNPNQPVCTCGFEFALIGTQRVKPVPPIAALIRCGLVWQVGFECSNGIQKVSRLRQLLGTGMENV